VDKLIRMVLWTNERQENSRWLKVAEFPLPVLTFATDKVNFYNEWMKTAYMVVTCLTPS